MNPLGVDLKLAFIYFAAAVFVILVPLISWAVHKYVQHVFSKAKQDAITVLKRV